MSRHGEEALGLHGDEAMRRQRAAAERQGYGGTASMNPLPGMQLLANRKDLVPVAYALLNAVDSGRIIAGGDGYVYQLSVTCDAIKACGTEAQLRELAGVGVLQLIATHTMEKVNGMDCVVSAPLLWGCNPYTRAWCMMCIVLNKDRV